MSESDKDKKVSSYSVVPIRAVTGLLEKNSATGSSLFKTKLGKLWDVSDKIAIEFIVEIEKRFRSKNKRFGNFSSVTASLPRELKTYCKSDDKVVDKNFSTFCQGVLDGLAHGADEATASAAAGGNVVIMHYSSYEEESLGRVLIVLLEKRGMFDFDSDMRPEKFDLIDTKAMKQAALIDVELFDVSFPGNQGEAYLRFIEGSSKADFFKTALGCNEKIDNEKSVQELDAAVSKFINDHSIDLDLAEEIKEGVKKLLIDHSKPNSPPLNIGSVQKRIDKILPEDSELKGSFTAFVNENEFEVNEWISPTNYQANKVGKIVLKDDNKSYDVEVSENSIGSMDSNKPVKITEDGQYLCFPVSGEKRRAIMRLVGKMMDKDDET
ncbi:MAG TPA: hypothetical protein DCX44_03515 [Halomonas sp.]|nr:nucleoid-associated protein [uncultured Halomonas sp.]HAV44360.1 hypothetical protein [Halomonas sp.]|tara:strand:+ start:2247 stop:3389 length:1143 start_codon:yes stop_codon:yes gene_type:complete